MYAQNTFITDDFTSGNYSGGTGWTGNWTETGDNNNSANGYISLGGQRLLLRYIWWETIQRSADLSGNDSATLTFTWQGQSLEGVEDLEIMVSTNGGSTFTTIGSVDDTPASGTFTADLTPYISENFVLRFGNDDRASGGDWTDFGDMVYIDNIQIELVPTNNSPVIAGTGDQNYCPADGNGIAIVETISITHPSSATIDAMHFQISSGYVNGEDLLALTGSHPGITSSWSAVEGKLTLSGTATLAAYQAAALAIQYTSSGSPSGNKGFSISIGSPNFLPATGHYYEYIAQAGISWTDARDAAAASTHFGMQGYLATLTSQAESDFAGQQAQGVGWIGGTDRITEGQWVWETGPEAGTVFWNGGPGGNTPNYAFWNTNEPNDYGGGGEDYAHITDNSIGIPGSWNDLANGGATGAYASQGYIVEYGGMPGDPTLNISFDTTIHFTCSVITNRNMTYRVNKN